MSASFTPVTSPTWTSVNRVGAAARDHARGALDGAHGEGARPVQADRLHAPAATRAEHRSTFTLPATVIFMTSSVSASVMRRPATIFGVCQFEPLLQLGGLGSAAVDHDHRSPGRAHFGDVGGDGRHVLPLNDLAAQLEDAGRSRARRHGYPPTSSSEARSSHPSIKFIDWIACPAPPFTRLSVAVKHATTRFPSVTSPT